MATGRKRATSQGEDLVDLLKVKYDVKTDSALAKCLGLTPAGLNVWRRWRELTPKQIVSVISRAEQAARKEVFKQAIRPVVEFFPIEKKLSKGEAKWEIFDASRTHPYLRGLFEELNRHHGVYVFFDSRGHAIYAGKARKQRLWREINLAFNRERGDVQAVKRVDHPSRKQVYRTHDEKQRRIYRREVPLYEMASYVSAYSVLDEMVDSLEAMLVRSFANDLLNVRMEKFVNGA
ncbi:hypothetical protein LJR290_007936 [Variovorax sp. LjRoot290]|uniref:hypothetical protein n=1 Tax=Variovorax sp. LjRoot290 TaxID=3342316 RepID=UPI003ECDD81E